MRRVMTLGSIDGATIAIIVAAGRGERAGGDIPKQFRRIGGRAVLAHAFDRLAVHDGIDGVLLVTGEGQEQAVMAAMGGRSPIAVVLGGATRQKSVRAALEHLASAGSPSTVLIHDAARPFLSSAVIDRLLSALGDAQGAIPVLPVVDTIALGDNVLGEVVDRSVINRVQTPQAFAFAEILAAHRLWSAETDATDDAQILRAAGHDVALVMGDRMLEKLTLPEDFSAAEKVFAGSRSVRTGLGYDVHRLVEKEELWLCGIQVPHDKGLSGHSDADVALHALVDALLGALAEGDIGSHFPPSDPQWRGAASWRFLEFARQRVEARGGIISHVDLTIICERPKVGPHRDAMRARVAELLGVSIGRVSVKATTTERLGFTGRGEGIAAQAIATLSLPDIE
ncbi:MAG: bifunctional 2-C-methyl-D-erythritol 4-phosphate cytidylyltransferase/2-C-methyl-D-erythritol 2,4-cyclodiphosphate synthase [Sphingobium phenoxybenzoativorans]